MNRRSPKNVEMHNTVNLYDEKFETFGTLSKISTWWRESQTILEKM